MSKTKFLAAQELIKEKKYDEARAILTTIDHPTAERWLAKLDEIAPPSPNTIRTQKGNRVLLLAAFIAGIVIIGVIFAVILYRSRGSQADSGSPSMLSTPILDTAEQAQIEAVTIYCMQQGDLTREECTNFSNNLIDEEEFSATIALCTGNYAGNLDAFSVCMKDIAAELKRRSDAILFQPIILYAYCTQSFTFRTLSGEGWTDNDCELWAHTLDALHPALRSVKECWGTHDLGEVMFTTEGIHLIIPSIVSCMATNLGSAFPPLPACDGLQSHATRASCSQG